MLDRYTFGNSNAAVVLVTLINEADSVFIQRSISRYLQKHGEILHFYISNVQSNPSMAPIFKQWWRDDIQKSSLEGIKDKIESFMKNVAMSKIPGD
jgi:hypothetical protein